MAEHEVVARAEWLVHRAALLRAEKEFTRARDRLNAQRRALPWVAVDKRYMFETPDGRQNLAELFAGRSQLIVYHFMFHPDWQEGCPSCSFWADNFTGAVVHLAARDVTLLAVSRAQLAKLAAYRSRLGWSFPWVSSFGSDFNRDFGVAFTPEEAKARAPLYNYGTRPVVNEELPGLSVFHKAAGGAIHHTYSTYARGLDMLNGAYHLLDLTPKGRDEAGLPYPMA
ncbi:MAG: DUF899 domain-containing protein [Alphaproteobacteria bacterium]|nr:DUF899 domain-containing protein [Alphaproteobacteria bacterium]